MREMSAAATVDNIEVVTAFINAELERMNCPEKVIYQIDIAVDELFGNIARYGYDAGEGPVTVRIEEAEAPRGVVITFIDQGIPYNPISAKAPDVTLKASMRPIGGLGVYMVKKSMDEVDYLREDGCNRLSIRKNF